MDDVLAAVRGIPALAGWQGQPQRLGGLTNRVYALGDHVLRLPGKGTEAYINRANEAVMARAAAAAGVSPAVVHADPTTGIMVTERIPDAVTMTPQGFRDRPGSAARAGAVLAQLHRSGAVFPFRFDLFAVMDDYRAILAPRAVALPPGFEAAVAGAEAVRAALSLAPVPLVPCHCDPLCENFLDQGQRMWLVDWEYAGMNDPMWDLGDLAVEGAFGPADEAAMLAAYFGGPAPAADRARMLLYKAMCDLLWSLWGLIQLSDGNPAEDFRAYADGRFTRARALMEGPDFPAALAALGG
jgi:thiamine kinase-like enzyme